MAATPLPAALRLPTLHPWALLFAGILALDALIFLTVFNGALPFNYTYDITPDNKVRLDDLLAEVERTWPDQRVLIKAVIAIRFDIGRQALPTLVAQLENPNADMRRFALYALGTLQDHTATPAVLERMHDPDSLVVFSATMALGDLGDPRARDALVAALDHPDYRVRASAALNLGLVGLRAGDAEALIAHIEDPHRMVGATIQNVLSETFHLNPWYLGRSRRLWEEWWATTGRAATGLPDA